MGHLFQYALGSGVTDLYIEPSGEVRLKKAGHVELYERLEEKELRLLVNWLKLNAGFELSDSQAPQDGRIDMEAFDRAEYRISLIPSVRGESLAIRLVSEFRYNNTFMELGFPETLVSEIKSLLHQSTYGFIPVVGPTGSGKTTTLYAMVRELNTGDRKIITVEDPVERFAEGVIQLETQWGRGLNFYSLLRSILRHDPDIIMVGEIRDEDTAKVALNASITGHLVLSSLHSGSSASAIYRLFDLGVDPYLLSEALVFCLSQRLLFPFKESLTRIFEFLVNNRSISRAILERLPPEALNEAFQKEILLFS